MSNVSMFVFVFVFFIDEIDLVEHNGHDYHFKSVNFEHFLKTLDEFYPFDFRHTTEEKKTVFSALSSSSMSKLIQKEAQPSTGCDTVYYEIIISCNIIWTFKRVIIYYIKCARAHIYTKIKGTEITAITINIKTTTTTKYEYNFRDPK